MTIAYTVTVAQPETHCYHVHLRVPEPTPECLLLTLPNWIPGSYMIRDMAGDVGSVSAHCQGECLPVEKYEKAMWRVSTRGISAPIDIEYDVYAYDNSVRLAYLDTERGFFNPSSLLLSVYDMECEPLLLTIKAEGEHEQNTWKVATALPACEGAEQGAWGTYRADDYNHLIDSPVELGNWEGLTFSAGGAEHEIVVSGVKTDFDRERLVDDVQKVCQRVIEFFEPETKKAPFERYRFLLNVTVSDFGGLEHAASTALVAPVDTLPVSETNTDDEKYRRLITLFAHEYFHAWWVKRVKPSAFIAYDLSAETYTKLLWVFEGFTSYYDNLLSFEAGVISAKSYLAELTQSFHAYQSAPSRKHQSLEESSFDAWIKFYKPNANRPNAVVNYYVKGAFVAMALDALIMKKSQGAHRLADVLRYAWQQYCEAGEFYAGIHEEGMAELVWEATGVEVATELHAWTQTCEEPDWQRVFKRLGYRVKTVEDKSLTSRLGALVRQDGGFVNVVHVYEGSAASAAGLAGGDKLVALNGIRVDMATLASRLERLPKDKPAQVHFFRRDVLMQSELKGEAIVCEKVEFEKYRD